MKARRALKFLGVVALLLPATAAAQDRFSLSSNKVAIYNVAGEIHLERGSGSNVIVEVDRAGRDADRLEIRRGQDDGWQQLVVHYPERTVVYPRGGAFGRFSRSEFSINDDGTFGRNLDPSLGTERLTAKSNATGSRRVRVTGGGSGLEAHAVMKVVVPEGKAVAIHLGVGKVSVVNVAADLQIDARSGSADAQSVRGFLRIDTGSGAIYVKDATGDAALRTGSGSVIATRIKDGAAIISTGSGGVELNSIDASALSVATGSGSIAAAGVSAPSLKLHTGSGGIRAHEVYTDKFDIDTGSGSIALDLRKDVDVGRIRTGSGGVTVTAASGLGAEVRLDTGSGGIDVDIPVTVIERKHSFFHGRAGDGRGLLDIGTGSGSISLR